MMRIIPFSEEEILLDPGEAGKVLNMAVRRQAELRFSCLCALGKEFLVVLEECEPGTPSDRDAEFHFSELSSSNREQVVATIQERWTAGETTLAVFQLADRTWGLFRKQQE